jgi:hypothetical protein
MTGTANARELTVRTWSATADGEGAGNYIRYFTSTLLPELRKLPGFEGAYAQDPALTRAHVTSKTGSSTCSAP